MVHRRGLHTAGGEPHGGHVVGFGICPNTLESQGGVLSRCLDQFASAEHNHFLQVAPTPRCRLGEENYKVVMARCQPRLARKRQVKHPNF